VKEFTADALQLLLHYQWPGNVRELRTAVEHAVVLCRGEKIAARDLPASLRAERPEDAKNAPQTALTIHEAEKQVMTRALQETNGNRTLAARKIGMSRRTFHRKLHAYHLEEL